MALSAHPVPYGMPSHSDRSWDSSVDEFTANPVYPYCRLGSARHNAFEMIDYGGIHILHGSNSVNVPVTYLLRSMQLRDFQDIVSDALARFNRRKLTWTLLRHPDKLTAVSMKALKYQVRTQGESDIFSFGLEELSLDTMAVCTVLRFTGIPLAPKSHEDENEKRAQCLAFLNALLRARSRQQVGAEERSLLHETNLDPQSRQTSPRDRMTASSRSLRGPTHGSVFCLVREGRGTVMTA